MRVYLAGSLRNPVVPAIGDILRTAGFPTFDEWFAGGPHADDAWRDYERGRGHSLPIALAQPYARNIYDFDKRHLDASDVIVLVLPAGKSAHMELGYMLGRGKPGIIQLDNDPDRYDVMYLFADAVTTSTEETLRVLRGLQMKQDKR